MHFDCTQASPRGVFFFLRKRFWHVDYHCQSLSGVSDGTQQDVHHRIIKTSTWEELEESFHPQSSAMRYLPILDTLRPYAEMQHPPVCW